MSDLLLLKPKGLPRNGLIAEWKFNEDVGATSIIDYSGRGNHLDNGEGTNAITFDGVQGIFGGDDYARLAALATMQGTVTVSMVNGTAFLEDTGQTEFGSFVRANGTSRYLIRAYDGSKWAYAYVGDLGTGRTYGDELVDGWTNHVSFGYETFTPGGGSDITLAENSVSYGIMYKAGEAINGALYKNEWSLTPIVESGAYPLSCWAQDASMSGYRTLLYKGGPSLRYYTMPSTGVYTHVGIYASNTTISFSFTNYSLRQVLTPTTSGITVYPTKTGETTGWAEVEAGFNANTITSYEIMSADFDFGTDSFSFGFAFKLDILGDQAIFSKQIGTAAANTGFGLYLVSEKLVARITDGTTTVATDGSGAALVADTWYRAQVIFDRTTNLMTIFVDAVQYGNAADISSVAGSVSNSLPLLIGARPAGTVDLFMNGNVGYGYGYNKSALSAVAKNDKILVKKLTRKGLI